MEKSMKNQMRPIHPGEILKDEIEELDMNPSALAKVLMVPANRVIDIIKGKRSITADTALRLSRFFGTTAEFWLNLQTAFDLKMMERKSAKQIYNHIQPYFEAA
jgi:addiction module HigA family antidote